MSEGNTRQSFLAKLKARQNGAPPPAAAPAPAAPAAPAAAAPAAPAAAPPAGGLLGLLRSRQQAAQSAAPTDINPPERVLPPPEAAPAAAPVEPAAAPATSTRRRKRETPEQDRINKAHGVFMAALQGGASTEQACLAVESWLNVRDALTPEA